MDSSQIKKNKKNTVIWLCELFSKVYSEYQVDVQWFKFLGVSLANEVNSNKAMHILKQYGTGEYILNVVEILSRKERQKWSKYFFKSVQL